MPRRNDPIVTPQAYVWEDTDGFFMARVQGHAGTNITQASVSSIAYAVYDMNNSEAVVTSGSLTVADVVFNALQTSDARWEADDTGYNFGATIPAAAFPTGGRKYFLKITFTPTSGSTFFVNYLVNAEDVPGG